MNTPKIVNHPPLRVEFSLNDHLSDTGYSSAMLIALYVHFLNLHWHRFFAGYHGFEPTLLHLSYWRAQIHYLGSDMIRRNFLTAEELNQDMRFGLKYTKDGTCEPAAAGDAGAANFLGSEAE